MKYPTNTVSPKTHAASFAIALALASSIATPQVCLAASSAGYVWPLESTGTVTQNYGHNGHTGTDIATPKGTDVLSMADGEVKYVQSWDGHTKTGMQSYGNLVIVYHPSTGAATYYAHLSDMSVSVGQKVSQGQVIGHVGSTGNSTGNHLHVELRTGAKSAHNTYGKGDGTTVDVLAYVSPADVSVEAAPAVLAGRWGNDVTNLPTEPVTIRLNGTDLALTVNGTAKGSEVTVATLDGQPHQLWTFEPQGDGSYKLRSSAGDIVLDIEGGSTRSGANVWTWVSNEATEERFFVELLDDGTYALRNAKSGLYVNIGDKTTVKSGDGVTLWAGPSADGRSSDQTWDIVGTSKAKDGDTETSVDQGATDSDATSESDATSGPTCPSDGGSTAQESDDESTDGGSTDDEWHEGPSEETYDDTHGFGSQSGTTQQTTGEATTHQDGPSLSSVIRNFFARLRKATSCAW